MESSGWCGWGLVKDGEGVGVELVGGLTEVFALLNSHLNINLATSSGGEGDNTCVNHNRRRAMEGLNSHVMQIQPLPAFGGGENVD